MTTATDNIVVGLIGAGGNTRLRHIPGLRDQAGVEIKGVVNRSLESSRRVADEFGIPEVYEDWVELLEDDDIDAVCIGTWPYMHAPLTVESLEEGKHVLVEARMAMNSDEALEMLDASKRAPHLIAQIVPAPHSLEIDSTIINLISEGFIGDLVNVRLQVGTGSDFPNPDLPLHWRHNRDFSGNNIMTMGIWYEAMMRWFGPAATVQALGQTIVKHRMDDGRRRSTSIPDHLDVLMNMEGGGSMNYTVTTVSAFARELDLWVHGTDGVIRVELADPNASNGATYAVSGARRGDGEMSPIEVPEENRGGWRVEEEFINAIRGIEPVTHTNFTDGLKYMQFTDAVSESVKSGDMVRLPL
ncbi:MAG: Gfo/Idh/MocA family oxidoreductase [Chloroflexi bacterium]|nr:Gfo/Idh/MocA family oxidoreductase [Chloroflexota bacterium]